MRKLELEDYGILQKAIDLWGPDEQLCMAFEELGETISEINKFRRGRSTTGDLASEIADAYIMLSQVEYMFGLSNMVDGEINAKLHRLAARIKKCDGNAV